jgi:hypothetical protein
MCCRRYGCSFDQLGHMPQHFEPQEQPHLEPRFLEPVSNPDWNSTVSSLPASGRRADRPLIAR